jgi:hypothetical protein
VSFALILLLVVAARSSRGAQRSPSDTFEALVQRYIEVRRDAGALSAPPSTRGQRAPKRLLREVAAIDPVVLSAEQRIDHATVVGQLEGTIFELDVLRPWEKDPELYLQYGSLAGLMDQPGDPATKGRAVAARLKVQTALLSEARANLKTPPKRFTDSDLPGRRVA